MSENIRVLCGKPVGVRGVCGLSMDHQGDCVGSGADTPVHPSVVSELRIGTASSKEVLLFMSERGLNHVHTAMGPEAGFEAHITLVPATQSDRFTRAVRKFFSGQ